MAERQRAVCPFGVIEHSSALDKTAGYVSCHDSIYMRATSAASSGRAARIVSARSSMRQASRNVVSGASRKYATLPFSRGTVGCPQHPLADETCARQQHRRAAKSLSFRRLCLRRAQARDTTAVPPGRICIATPNMRRTCAQRKAGDRALRIASVPRIWPFIFVAELSSGAARKSRVLFWKNREAAYTCCKSAGRALEIACWLHKN